MSQLIHQSSSLRSTAALIVAGVMLLSLTTGCSHWRNQKFTGDQKRMLEEESTFAAGSGRKPTAATSHAFAKLLIGQKRDHDALIVLIRVIREQPKFIPAYNEIAGIYVRSDRLDDAVSILTAGLKIAPHDGVLLNNLGICHLLKEDHILALDAFTRAAKASPTNPQYRANRATALALSGREKDAEAEYRSIISTSATRHNLLVLAKVRHEQDKAAEAPADALEAALKTPATQPTTAPAALAHEKLAITLENPKPATQPAKPATRPAPAATQPALVINNSSGKRSDHLGSKRLD